MFMADELSAFQQQIVHAPPQGEIVVGGVAGSGKTVAAVHRAAALCRQTRWRNDEPAVLFLCFNRALAAAVRQMISTFPGSIQSRIRVRTVHQWCAPYVRRQFADYRVLADNAERLALVREAMHQVRTTAGDHEVFAWDAQVLLDEIRLIKGCDLLEREVYLDQWLARPGALPAADGSLVFAVAETYARMLRERRLLDYDDFAPIALGAVSQTRQPQRCDHVIMDEAQDLTALQIDLGRRIARQSLLLIADQDQAIYRVAQLPGTLPPAGGYNFILPASLRTTAPIFAWARHLLPENTSAPLPRRQGPPPLYRTFRWCEDEADFIGATVADLLDSGCAAADIAILVRLYELIPPLAAALARRGIPVAETSGQPAPASVHLTTIHAAKGREFHAVIVAGLVEGVLPRLMPEMDRAAVGQELALARRQLYVAMTRARERLWLTASEGPPSRFLAEIGVPSLVATGGML